MFKRIASLLLVALLAVAAAGAAHDAPGLASYSVIVAAAALALTALAALPALLRPLPQGAKPAAGPLPAGRSLLRTGVFCFVWAGYAAALDQLGFVVASALALVASLWIVLGRFRPSASIAAVIFVLAIAVLVTTVLYVPVPKGPVDYWIDEAIFALRGD